MEKNHGRRSPAKFISNSRESYYSYVSSSEEQSSSAKASKASAGSDLGSRSASGFGNYKYRASTAADNKPQIKAPQYDSSLIVLTGVHYRSSRFEESKLDKSILFGIGGEHRLGNYFKTQYFCNFLLNQKVDMILDGRLLFVLEPMNFGLGYISTIAPPTASQDMSCPSIILGVKPNKNYEISVVLAIGSEVKNNQLAVEFKLIT